MARIPLIPKVIQVTLSYLVTALACLAFALMMQVIFELNTAGIEWTTATVFVGSAVLAVTLHKAQLHRALDSETADDTDCRINTHAMIVARGGLDEDAGEGSVTPQRALSFKRVAFVASLFVGLALVFVAHEYVKSEQVITTGASQWQHMTLPDGTAFHVDARSRIKVEYTDQTRVVHLREGGAVFDVAKDSERPFIVTTDLVDITAVGTRFGVSIDPGVTTTVSEGIVTVTIHGRVGGEAVTLRAGQELRVSDSSPSSPQLAEVDAEDELQWANGLLILREKTIAEGVEEFNRRNRLQIVVHSPKLAAKVLDFASVKVDSPESYAQLIAAQPGVRMTVDKENGLIRLSE